MKFSILASIGFLGVNSFNLGSVKENVGVPRTNIGDSSVASNAGSARRTTNGFGIYFSDNVYACSKWNHKAKDMSGCFVALNGVCGMKTGEFCDKCIEVTNVNGQTQKCTLIDFCDPSNCDFLDPGHLDFLNNNGNAAYKTIDKGKYVEPYKGAGGQPIITWRYC